VSFTPRRRRVAVRRAGKKHQDSERRAPRPSIRAGAPSRPSTPAAPNPVVLSQLQDSVACRRLILARFSWCPRGCLQHKLAKKYRKNVVVAKSASPGHCVCDRPRSELAGEGSWRTHRAPCGAAWETSILQANHRGWPISRVERPAGKTDGPAQKLFCSTNGQNFVSS